ncbi:hypothetical protein ACE1TH_16215 [Shouchella sp. JSM 1781072]|uniref:hypothetical protein n=1 Tax=Bacillaceae TaxID=186817 RepID=UPI00159BA936|nr:hypothetical protein [Bacillus sp. Marseille-P3800]
MFNPTDWLRLIMAALVILPIVTVIRESGYYLIATLLRGKNKHLIIGSGPTLFKIPTIEVRRYFFMFSWMEYDELEPRNRFWHGLIYAAPIITTGIFAFSVNSLVLNEVLSPNIFWTTFIFYCFYYMLFDLIPVYLPDGQPTNGRAIFDLIWHGERSDYKKARLEQEAQEEETNEDESDRSNTEAQEETKENRDRDDEERDDHTNPESSQEKKHSDNEEDKQRSYTEAQEETKENRDRDDEERSDHTKSEENK